MNLVPSGPGPKPQLERALPADAVPDSTRPVDHTAQEVLMTDGSWQYCEILAQARGRDGKWRVLVRWYDPGPPRAQRDDWLIYEAPKFRRPDGLGGRGTAGEHRRGGVDGRDCGPGPDWQAPGAALQR